MATNDTKSDKNAIKYAERARHEVRRPEYEIKETAWIKDLLQRGAFASVATEHEGQPFVTPLLYVYEEEKNALYFHTAQVGRLRANIEFNPRVCFNVSEFGRLLPHQEAVEFNVEYNSVTVFGQASIVESQEEAGRVLQLLLDKYAPHLRPGQDYNPVQPEEIKRTSVYRVRIEDWSGKRQQEPDDYPGAFHYAHPPLVAP